MSGLPEVAEIWRWKLEPGDRLIVITAREPTMAEVDYIKDRVRASLALDDDFPVLVHGPSVRLEVASA